MKKFITFLFALAVISAIGGCKDADTDYTAACMKCHTAGSTIGQKLIYAQDGFRVSGHTLGPRVKDPNVASTGHIYVHHGSNAMYASSCGAQCHNHEGFLGISNPTTSSTINCFTCHAPHEKGNFGLTKTADVSMVNGGTFSGGSGNLCASCHRMRSTTNAHHGPQAEMLYGVGFRELNATQAPGGNYTISDITPASNGHRSFASDTCVTCHMASSVSRTYSISMGGHGFYLTADVHGSVQDLTQACESCHGEDKFADSGSFDSYNGTMTALCDLDGDGNASENIIQEISGAVKNLAVYYATDTDLSCRPVTAPDGGTTTTANNYGVDWKLTSTSREAPCSGVTMADWESITYFNFSMIVEDKSRGIHNLKATANALYYAIRAINSQDGTGITTNCTSKPRN